MTRPLARGAVLAACAAVLLVAPSAAPAAPEVAYRLSYAAPGADRVDISVAWDTPIAAAAAFIMPRAIPMGYGEQRYDAFVVDVRAVTANEVLAAARAEGPRWTLPVGTRGVRYQVDVRAMEQAIVGASDASRMREGYLGVLGYSIFGYVDGFEAQPVTLRVDGPAGWPIFSTLAPRAPMTAAPIETRAPNFYALADGQIVMGPRAVVRKVDGTPVPTFHVSYSEGEVDLDRTARLIATAMSRVADYFGSLPFPHYTVHQELLRSISPRHEYGMSMEHLESSTYYLEASAALTSSSTAQDERRVLYNFAHHIAHAWLPKRLAGEGYFPFQWELAPLLDTVWFAEGFGQYAAIMALAPAMPDPAAYRTAMLDLRFRSNVKETPAFLGKMDLVTLSRVASTRYAEDFRTGRLVFSRGGLMAAAIDDRIREVTKGEKSLRDGLRFLMAWSAREQRGFRVEELAPLLQQATGVDVRSIVDAWLRPLP